MQEITLTGNERFSGILDVPALLAGEISILRPDCTLRGPIKSIVTHSHEIAVLLHWCALMDNNGEWHHVAIPQIELPWISRFVRIDDGTVLISGPNIIAGAFYPKGTLRLDPKIIHGKRPQRRL